MNYEFATDLSSLYLKHFSELDWRRVCRVKSKEHEWYYEDINNEVMFSEHRSWVYIITVNGKIFKIGETGNPLGIRGNYSNDSFKECQPKLGTKCRLGRYRRSGDSDENIRQQLKNETRDPDTLVEFWAHKCKEESHKMVIAGMPLTIKYQIHKSLEKELINTYINLNDDYPPGNCGRY
jgi:hypothetical protein